MATQCVSPIKASVARFTRLDACGVPVTGVSSAQIVVDGFTEISNTPNYEAGQRFLLKKANGQPCVNQKDPGFLNWIEQTIMLCTLYPDALTLVTADRLIANGVTGTGVAFGEGLLTARYSTEVWQPVAGQCTAAGLPLYVYWAFPNTGDAQIQGFTFANDTFTFGWKQETRKASPLWTLGASWLANGGTWSDDEHFAFNITSVAPPVAGCAASVI